MALKKVLSKLAKPLAACLAAAVPVGAPVLADASIRFNLLCWIAALLLTSALTITSSFIVAVSVLLDRVKVIAPPTVTLIKLASTPVNAKI